MVLHRYSVTFSHVTTTYVATRTYEVDLFDEDLEYVTCINFKDTKFHLDSYVRDTYGLSNHWKIQFSQEDYKKLINAFGEGLYDHHVEHDYFQEYEDEYCVLCA